MMCKFLKVLAPLSKEWRQEGRSFIKLLSLPISKFAPDDRKRAQTAAIRVKQWFCS